MPSRVRLIRPPRILIASDRDHAVGDVQSSLGRRGYSVLRVYDEPAVVERARSARPDAILLDGALIDGRSHELARALRADPAVGEGTPLLLLVAGRPAPHERRAALRAGIWELVTPPVDAAGLAVRLDRAILAKVETERTPRRQLVDETTGLYTTHGLERRTWALLFQGAQHDASVACVVLAPRDPAARPLGAPLLAACARALEAGGRRSDAIGRMGPDTFAVVAPGANLRGARRLAGRLRSTLPAREGVELVAGWAAARHLRTAPLEPRQLLERAAQALGG